MMHIGFTGSRFGMEPEQKQELEYRMIMAGRFLDNNIVFHHGDCIGSDAQAHIAAIQRNFKIVVHPPTNNSKRAFCGGAFVTEVRPLPYLERNKVIVGCSDILVATPNMSNPDKSGSWYTIGFAQQLGKRILVIKPSGEPVWFLGKERID